MPDDENTESTAPETPDEALGGEQTADEGESTEASTEPPEGAETFPREYVERLRDENARYRQRAHDRDALAERLHVALVAATGRLADPTDLPFDGQHLEDEHAIDEAIDELLRRKPHLASRRPSGDVGQGAASDGSSVDLAEILRARA